MMTDGANPSARNSLLALNQCEIPAWVIASSDFNTHPQPLSLAGVLPSNRHFFRMLEEETDVNRRGQMFHDYLAVRFELHHYKDHKGYAKSSLRNSYMRFLRGWEVDSNGIEGAVMKSWVQSRFGILPTYHSGKMNSADVDENSRFAYDRMRGGQKTNAIYSQLDLLYAYCQWEWKKRFPDRPTIELFRGTNDPDEHPILERGNGRSVCVRLNNLVSFTVDPEKAWEFGSTVWRTTVAFSKIIFYSGLLPDSLLYGEGEYLVIGGDYWVSEMLY